MLGLMLAISAFLTLIFPGFEDFMFEMIDASVPVTIKPTCHSRHHCPHPTVINCYLVNAVSARGMAEVPELQ